MMQYDSIFAEVRKEFTYGAVTRDGLKHWVEALPPQADISIEVDWSRELIVGLKATWELT